MNQNIDQSIDEQASLITKDSSYRRKSQLYQQDINVLGRSFVSSGSYFQTLNNKKSNVNNSNVVDNPYHSSNNNDNKGIHKSYNLHKETALITDTYDQSNKNDNFDVFNDSFKQEDTIDSEVNSSSNKNIPFSPISSHLESLYGSLDTASSNDIKKVDVTGPPNYQDIAKFKSLSNTKYCSNLT